MMLVLASQHPPRGSSARNPVMPYTSPFMSEAAQMEVDSAFDRQLSRYLLGPRGSAGWCLIRSKKNRKLGGFHLFSHPQDTL